MRIAFGSRETPPYRQIHKEAGAPEGGGATDLDMAAPCPIASCSCVMSGMVAAHQICTLALWYDAILPYVVLGKSGEVRAPVQTRTHTFWHVLCKLFALVV